MLARENPFKTSRIKMIPYQWGDVSPSELFAQLKNNKFRGAILGKHGSGKSTLLRTVKCLLENEGYRTVQIFINRETRVRFDQLTKETLSACRSGSVLVIDGADLLPWYNWSIVWFLSWAAAGIVVTSHEQQLLPVLCRCSPGKRLVHDITRSLVGAEVQQPDISEIFEKHSGNIREVLRELYDHYSSLGNDLISYSG